MDLMINFLQQYPVETIGGLIAMVVLLLLVCFLMTQKHYRQQLTLLQQKSESSKQLQQQQIDQLTEQHQQQQTQLQQKLKQNNELSGFVARLQEHGKHLKQQAEQIPELQNLLKRAEQRNIELTSQAEQQQQRLQQQSEFIQQAQQDLSNQFNTLGQKILDQKAQKFTEQNQQNMQHVVQPLRQQLEAFQNQLKDNRESSLKQTESLKHQLHHMSELNQTLSDRAEALTKALVADSKTQGNWGEMILQRLLDLSGLQQGREYETEVSFRQDGNLKRLDVLLNLPNQKHLIIDAKVSLTDYQNYSNSEDAQQRQQALKKHLNSVHKHIDELSRKNYQSIEQIHSVDFVLMFIPVEAAYLTAINADTQLLQKAYDKNVLLLSASNLLATLRTVMFLWSSDKQEQNSRQIAQRAGKLIDKFIGFYDDFNKIRNQIEQTQKTWQDAENKLKTGQGNLYRQIEQLTELGAKATKKLPD